MKTLGVDCFLGGYKGYLAYRSFEEFLPGISKKYSVANIKGEDFDFLNIAKELIVDGVGPDSIHGQRSPLAICVGWQKIIREGYERIIVIHDSLLPAYRGWNPLVTALERGDGEIGISMFYAEETMDSGPIIFQCATEVMYPITISQALDKLQPLFHDAAKFLSLCDNLLEISATPQDYSRISYSLWRDEEDYVINWSQNCQQIENFVNSRSWPYAGAKSRVNGEEFRILAVECLDYDYNIVNRSPGKLVAYKDNLPVVVCGSGLVRILEIRDSLGNDIKLRNLRIRFS